MALGEFLAHDVVGRPYLMFSAKCLDVVMFWKKRRRGSGAVGRLLVTGEAADGLVGG
jgi:hypothetical protein